jgi:NADPH-dependent 2,4-dienoyl-CoA reductase/sulfur reductase-like enzyme
VGGPALPPTQASKKREIMKHYPYLIIGGGMTAHAAVQGIRSVDADRPAGLFSLEKYPPYQRPPLTKGLWKGKPLEKIWMKDLGEGVELHLGERITRIDVQTKQVRSEQGEVYGYDRLLLATGARLRELPFCKGHILYYRTLADYQRVRALTGQGKRFAVIGGGFIASELAAALAMNGEQVTLIFPEDGLGRRIFPRDLSVFLNDYYRQNGVEVLGGRVVTGIEAKGDQFLVSTGTGNTIQADHVLAGIGVQPNTGLAEAAGLAIDNGITVDETLHTSQADIFAAGDVATFYNPVLKTRMRVEHEDNALTMGRAAGVNMALQENGSQLIPYHHLPYFYSDLFDLGYEAVGDLDSRLETTSDWEEPFYKGVIYYRREKQVRGVLLWNVWGQVDAARKLIAEPSPVDLTTLEHAIAK